MSDQEDWDCPLCMEELDITERNFKPCPCGYQICRFCWHHIKEELNGKCPACRRAYSDENVQFIPMTPSELNRIKAASKAKDREKKEIEGMSRKHLANVRVVQKSLIYVIGLTAKITDEMLRSNDFFGQYGKITKIVINRRHAQNSTSTHPGQSPTVGVYITYARREDAAKAISAVDGSMYNGRMLRAAYGTTKYCTYYLRNLPCQNPNCMYLHEPGEEADTFTKEDLTSGNHTFDDQHQQLEQSPKPPTLNVHSHSPSVHTNGYPSPRRTEAPVAIHRSESKSSDNDGGSALPPTASWAKLANKPKPVVPKASTLSLDHFPPPLSASHIKPKSKVITIPAKKPVKSEETKVEAKEDQKNATKQKVTLETKPETKPSTKRDTKVEAQPVEKVNVKSKAKEDLKQPVKSESKPNNETKEENKQPNKAEPKTKVTTDSKDISKALTKSESEVKPEIKAAASNEKTKQSTKADSKSKVKSEVVVDSKDLAKSSTKSGSKESSKADAKPDNKAVPLDEKAKSKRQVEAEIKTKEKKLDTSKRNDAPQPDKSIDILSTEHSVKQASKVKPESDVEEIPTVSTVASKVKKSNDSNKKVIPNDKNEVPADSKSSTVKNKNTSNQSVERKSEEVHESTDKVKTKGKHSTHTEPKTENNVASTTDLKNEVEVSTSTDVLLKEDTKLEKEGTEDNNQPSPVGIEAAIESKSEISPLDNHIEQSSESVNKESVALPAATVPAAELVKSSAPVEPEPQLLEPPMNVQVDATEESLSVKEATIPAEGHSFEKTSNNVETKDTRVEHVNDPSLLDKPASVNVSSVTAEKELEEASDSLRIPVNHEVSAVSEIDTKPPSEMTQLPRNDKTPLIPIIQPSFTQGASFADTRQMDIKQSLLGAITEGNQSVPHHSPSELEEKYLQDMFSQMRSEQLMHQRNQPGASLPPGFSDVFSGPTSHQRHEQFVHSRQVESFSMKPPENPVTQDLLSVLRGGRMNGSNDHPVPSEPTRNSSGSTKTEIFSQGLTPTQAQRNIAYEQSLARSSEQMAKPKQYSKFGFALSDDESAASSSGFNHPLGHPMSPNSLGNTNNPGNYSPYSMNQFMRNQGGTNVVAMQEGFRALFPNVNVSFNEKTGEATYGIGPRMNLNDHRPPTGEDWRSNSYLPSHEQHYSSFMGQGQQHSQSPMRNIPGGMAPPGYGVGHRPPGHMSSFGMDNQYPDMNRPDMGMHYGQGGQRDIRSPPQYSYPNNVPSWNDPPRRQNNDMNNHEHLRRHDAHHFNMTQASPQAHRTSATASDFFSDFLKAAAEKRLSDSQSEQSRGTALPFEDPAIMTARISEQNASAYNNHPGQNSLRNMRTQNPNVNLLSAFQNGPQSSMNSVNFAQPSHPPHQQFAAFHQQMPPSSNDFPPNHTIPPAAFRASQYP